jgi:hypothetical protein
VSSGRHAIYIVGLSVFLGQLRLLWMLQALVSRKGSDCIENLIITLSVRESCSELWGCIQSFIVEYSSWKTVRSLSR